MNEFTSGAALRDLEPFATIRELLEPAGGGAPLLPARRALEALGHFRPLESPCAF